MSEQAFSDEVLMAYADGELTGDTVQALEDRLQKDAALAQRLSLFSKTGALLAVEVAENPPEEISDALMARVAATIEAARDGQDQSDDEPDDIVVDFIPTTAPQPTRWQPMALAASLALAIGLGAGYGASTMNPRTGSGPLISGLLESRGVQAALYEMSAGEVRTVDGGSLTLIASFRNAQGAFCRELEFDGATGGTVVSVVCHEGAGWDTRLAVVTPRKDEASYAPASALETLDAYLAAIGADAPLMAEEEAEVLEGLLP